MLPPWIDRSNLRSGLGEDSVDQSSRFLESHIKIYGLQHFASNMNIDSHKDLTYWDEFFEQLKNFEAMLELKERRDRFLWTCTRGTQWEAHWAAAKIRKFKGKLYEKKWKYVTKFIGRLLQVMFFLRFTFSARRYKGGVDRNDNKIDQGAEAAGVSAFDPDKLEASLRNGLFMRYANLIFYADSIPEFEIAAFCEKCICHEKLFCPPCPDPAESRLRASKEQSELNDYSRRKILEAHFGPGIRCCPLAGKWAPELADGMMYDILDRSWVGVEAELLNGEPFLREVPLTPSQQVTLLKDMAIIRGNQTTFVRVKNGYYLVLPWLFASLAVLDENRARINAFRIEEQWAKDPRPPPVHDQKTWELMRPGSAFLAELHRFQNGHPRWECLPVFTNEVASTRQWASVETTIEEKHGRVSLASRGHQIGSVRVSLANRISNCGCSRKPASTLVTLFITFSNATCSVEVEKKKMAPLTPQAASPP